jgi:putative ribosome biogenesis GTPase RsgA
MTHGTAGFVGRGRELDRLQACYEAAAAGDAQVVAVVGPAGIGKTALVERFVAGLPARVRRVPAQVRAHGRGGRVARRRARPVHRP